MTLDQLLLGIVTLIGSFGGYQGIALLTNKIRLVKKMTKNETVNNALQRIEDTIADVVVFCKTTMVDQIKEASADGKLTKEEIDAIVETAKHRIFTIVKEDSLLILHDVVNDVDAWVENKIEKHVELSKRK